MAEVGGVAGERLRAFIERIERLEEEKAALATDIETRRTEYERVKAELEGSLSDVKGDLDTRNADRTAFAAEVTMEPYNVYERVRRKHADALAIVDGTVDRAANRMGSDLHCSACYMTITANDAVKVLARDSIVQCKSCVRILYVT